jgi:hypothetical protein
MGALILGLLQAGPSLIRAVGGLFGGDTAKTADSVANVVEGVRGLPDAVAQAKLGEHIAQMTPEQQQALGAIQVQLAKIDQEREAARLAAETAQQAQSQETARAEVQSGDEYVRHTRPMLARYSAYVTFAYALITGLVFPAATAITALWGIKLDLPGPQSIVAATLFSPCLSYIGARTVDAFSKTGKT